MAFSTKLNLDNSKVIQSDGCALTLSGDTKIASVGILQYTTDQSASYISRSVPDASYVTGKTSAIVTCLGNNYYTCTQINKYTGTTVPANYYNRTQINSYTAQTATVVTKALTGATNGLSYASRCACLGGSLTVATTITIPSTTSLLITDGRAGAARVGIQYGGDYGTTYTARSIPDAGWVTGKTYTKTQIDSYTATTNQVVSRALTGATNGLTKSNRQVLLGGALTQATTINGAFPLSMNVSNVSMTGSSVNLTGGLKLYTTPTGGTSTDSILVWNSTDKRVKTLAVSIVGAVTGATNGLNKSGQNVLLGGPLTQATIINGAFPLSMNVSNVYMTGSTVGLTGGLKLYTTPTGGTITDTILVWNSTDKRVKCLSVSSVTGATALSFTNGLTKTLNATCLGGALTQATALTGAYTLSVCGGANLNTTCGYQISGATIFDVSRKSLTNIRIGQTSLANITTGTNNIAIGSTALQCTLTGIHNIGIGCAALSLNTGGTYNTAVGAFSLKDNTSGCENTAVGTSALRCNIIGRYNVAVGMGALCNTNSNYNTALGYGSGENNVSGTGGVFIGYSAGGAETTSNKLYIDNNSTNRPLIYGEFDTHCAIVYGAFKTSGATSLLVAPAAGVTSDAILVWNSADKIVKQVSGTAVLTSAITGVTNGLSKSGQCALLGGGLTQNTTISGTCALTLSSPLKACNTQYMVFNCAPASIPSNITGNLYYSATSLNFQREFPGVILQVGEETVIRVYNGSGGVISNGTVVYISGATGGIPSIRKAIASSRDQAIYAIGVTTMNINDTAQGYVTMVGLVHDINTATFAVGSRVYLSSSTPGAITATPPLYPNELIHIGYVVVQNAAGTILVNMDNETPYTTIGQFTGYTATTKNTLNSKLAIATFSAYTGTTNTCIIYLDGVADRALTGATNGLSYSNRCACLGGTISTTTVVCGAQSLKFGDLCGITLSTHGTTDIGLNAKSNGGVYLKSQSGTLDSISDFTSAVGIGADYNAVSGFVIYDCRVAGNQTGIIYAGNYSANYTTRSLVDKAYVDSVATGLDVHAAVVVATTGATALTGFATVDGVVTTTGMRVLVKNQADGTKNGIYSASTGTWGRTSDYNFNPSGEIGNGDLISVISGITNANSIWVLNTPNPIVSGVTSLIYSKFLQQVGIVEGNGINITTSGVNKCISVELGTSACGLAFAGTGLTLDFPGIAGYGLTCRAGTAKIDVRACICAAVGSAIPVSYNSGTTTTLYVDSTTVATCLGTPIVTANNGLRKTGCVVSLGGNLTGHTTICGNSGTLDLSFISLNRFNLGFDSRAIITDSAATPSGLTYATNYGTTFVDRSLVDKYYVNNAITASTITYNNGLTKAAKIVSWGGTLTGNTQIIYGANRLCMRDGGVSCMDMMSDCSRIHTENSRVVLTACTNGNCYNNITLPASGSIFMCTNAATPINITATKAMAYTTDYASVFTTLSIPSAGWVTGCTYTKTIINKYTGTTVPANYYNRTQINSYTATTNQVVSRAITGATNGLTKPNSTSRVVCLGGALTQATTINGAFPLSMNVSNVYMTGTTVGLTGGLKLYTTPTGGTVSDLILVWNATDKRVKCLTVASVTGATALSFNNGLTKTLNAVCLGGALTQAITTINGAQTLRMNVSTLSMSGNTAFNLSTALGTITDTGTNGGLKYAADYSANVVALSIPSAKWVTGCTYTKTIIDKYTGTTVPANYYNRTQINSYTATTNQVVSRAITGATNGLTKPNSTSRVVCLGGALTQATIINGAFPLSMNVSAISMTGSTVSLSGGLKLFTTPTGGTVSDVVLVWNATDKRVKCLTVASITGATALSFNNGLTKTLNAVCLGGALTQATTINGAFGLSMNVSNISMTGSSINLTGGLKLYTTPTGGTTSDAVLVWNSTDKRVKCVSGTLLGDKNNIYAYSAVTTSVVLNTGSSYVILANPAAPIVLTLPATPKNGLAYKIKDISGTALTNLITICGNGKNIDGSATGMINTSYGALELLYNGTAWFSLAFIN
jgi:hypothetical protein